VDKERLDDLPVPLLSHSSQGGGNFVVINDIEKQIRSDKEFEQNWDGIVVLAEKPANWYHADNEKALAGEELDRRQLIVAAAVIGLLAVLSLYSQITPTLAALMLVAITGLGITILIVQQELGISNQITEQLCNASKETDCHAVILSKGSRIGKWLNWADAGIIYFSSFLVLLVASPGSPMLSLIAAAAIPFIFFSVYYQWRMVKKWCTLCLLTIGALAIQFVLLLPDAVKSEVGNIRVEDMAFTAFTFASLAFIWLLLVKPSLKRNEELSEKNKSLLRFKNNPDIFSDLLVRQRKVDMTPFENDLQLGNPDSPIQIMVACNPYCAPCAKAHRVLHELVEKNDIGLTVRFTINAEQPDSGKTQVVQHIVQHLAETGHTALKSRQLLNDWFMTMNYEKFIDKYPIAEKVDVSDWMKRQEAWVTEANIKVTPTIFINGNELPKSYSVNDLNNIIRIKIIAKESGNNEVAEADYAII